MRRIALIALTAFLASSASAQPKMIPRAEDHLEPQASILGGAWNIGKEDLALREAFDEMFARDIAVRVMVTPAFFPQYALALRRTTPASGTTYRIFALTLTKWLQSIEPVTIDKSGRVKAPPLPWKQKLNRCETPIKDGLGERITEVWRKMLMQTRYSAQYAGGLDGEFYDFSMDVRGLGPISGKVWSPDRNSRTGRLVALAHEMYFICTKEKGASMDNLEKLTAELEHRLK